MNMFIVKSPFRPGTKETNRYSLPYTTQHLKYVSAAVT